MFEESFGIIPIKKEKELLVFLVRLKSGNHWSFPKGHIHPEEDPLTCAKRELYEETHLTVEKILKEIPFIEEYYYTKNGKDVFKQVSYFLALVNGDIILQNEEILEGKWCTSKEASSLLSYQNSKKIWQEAVTFLEN